MKGRFLGSKVYFVSSMVVFFFFFGSSVIDDLNNSEFFYMVEWKFGKGDPQVLNVCTLFSSSI